QGANHQAPGRPRVVRCPLCQDEKRRGASEAEASRGSDRTIFRRRQATPQSAKAARAWSEPCPSRGRLGCYGSECLDTNAAPRDTCNRRERQLLKAGRSLKGEGSRLRHNVSGHWVNSIQRPDPEPKNRGPRSRGRGPPIFLPLKPRTRPYLPPEASTPPGI